MNIFFIKFMLMSRMIIWYWTFTKTHQNHFLFFRANQNKIVDSLRFLMNRKYFIWRFQCISWFMIIVLKQTFMFEWKFKFFCNSHFIFLLVRGCHFNHIFFLASRSCSRIFFFYSFMVLCAVYSKTMTALIQSYWFMQHHW